MKILKPVIISITFVAGFSLISLFLERKLKHKKIYSLLIEIGYFLVYWIIVYLNFMQD